MDEKLFFETWSSTYLVLIKILVYPDLPSVSGIQNYHFIWYHKEAEDVDEKFIANKYFFKKV